MKTKNSFNSPKNQQPLWLNSYINSPEKHKQLQRRTLLTVVLSQIFGGAGLAAGVTVGALLAQEMLGTDSYAGVPTALFTLGSAGAALLVGWLSQRHGRRLGLATGFLSGGIGAVGVVLAADLNNIVLLFLSLLVYGAGTATNLQARYAGTDLASPAKRATAVSIAMVSTTLGAVAGPNLVEPMGQFAKAIGVPALAGPFILGAVAYILAGLVLLVFLRPDPLLVASAIAATQKSNDATLSNNRQDNLAKNQRGVIVGATVMILTQIVMTSIMTMTPVHMRHHGHGLSQVGLVIGFHIGAMYLPSLITGILVDKIGRTAIAVAAGTTLLAAGILSAVASTDSVTMLIIALALLGLGWNFGLISGTAIIVDSTNSANRAKIQGSIDVLIALAGALGGVLSGMIVDHFSFATLSYAGALLALHLIPVILWSRSNRNQATQ
ncbi:MFS transporter [Paenibacillus sp. PK3_47]|uniref:MFS transporter n=1 Tax=Paenibacillus sp. PK3_47 TaxID=2072642 RepID=UPI00201D9CC2|nr:MFS transporter [Paenibacillus sp. PK3_47]UQZ33424.1 MFS transporter [Paenibacillus sp. PK3_47]